VNFHKNTKWGKRMWSLGLYNAYNRKNPFFIYPDSKFDVATGKNIPVLKQISLFPIIPSISYSFQF